MKKKYTKLSIILFFLFKTLLINSQDYSNERDYYNWFDTIIGSENIGIYEGVAYKKNYRTINEYHEYYISTKFLTGDIVYDRQVYYDIDMKYNIYDDELIVKLPVQSGHSIIKLISEKVEWFSLNNHEFIRLSKKNNAHFFEKISGFFEISFQNTLLTLYKKNKKTRKKQLDIKLTYSEFKDKNEYFLYYNKEYYKIRSKKDLVQLFPNQKKSINTFYSINKVSLNSNSDIFMNKLIKHLSSLINTTVN